MYENYLEIKKDKNNELVLVKSGAFYRTYDDDAIVLSYLCDYKVTKDNMVGFPVKSLSKIRKKLERECICYYNDDFSYYVDENNYDITLKKSQSDI